MRHAFFAAIGLLAAAIALPATIAVPAMAQSESQDQASTFSEQELKTFASAVAEVRSIGQTYQPQLEAAETKADKQAVRREATQQMAAAIKEEGITIERYKEITRAARADPELARKISGYINAGQ